MFNIIEMFANGIQYLTGPATLPWILIGFIVTFLLSQKFGEERIDGLMKKIGLILLFVFIPILLFFLFLKTSFNEDIFDFIIVTCLVVSALYLVAYLFAIKKASSLSLDGLEKTNFLKTVIVNQGRSSAFFGSAIFSVKQLQSYAGIYITLVGIFLFAIVPYVLSILHKKEGAQKDNVSHIPLPFFLKIYPWYLLVFPASAIIINSFFSIDTSSSNSAMVLLEFFGKVTIPAALFYVGSGIKIEDLKLEQLKNLFSRSKSTIMIWVKQIILLTMVVTPLIVALFFGLLLVLDVVPSTWVAVLLLNAILPITSTNMFLVPYGIDKKVTALSVTWSTFISIPLFLLLLFVFSLYFS